MRIRRALFSVSDKSGVVELARALAAGGTELVATGRTAETLREAGLAVRLVEELTGMPEAFAGRMKTLSFQVCAGILARRGDPADEADLARLGIAPIDCVVVNFYPFESSPSVETIDIGGPTLVRAAAKNAPDTLVLCDPALYPETIRRLGGDGAGWVQWSRACAARAWARVAGYDAAIAAQLGDSRPLRYGENPHQTARLELDAGVPPIRWDLPLTPNELSYNNLLDVASAYELAADLKTLAPGSTGVVIVKHNNPCGVACVPQAQPQAQKAALLRAWEGDPVSAFGGVLVFTDALEPGTLEWLADRFVEVVAAPGLAAATPGFAALLERRKALKAVAIARWDGAPRTRELRVPGGRLVQDSDLGLDDELRSVTRREFPAEKARLARFGIAVARALKSNALAIVREVPEIPGALQLIGTGQGQPNRVEALKALALPRAQAVLREAGGALSDAVLVSDAFFPFRDTVDLAHSARIRFVVQPGGSKKDAESVAACDEHGMAMAFTGVRHFRH